MKVSFPVKIQYEPFVLNSKNSNKKNQQKVNLIMPTLSPDEPKEKRLKKIANSVTKLSAKEKMIVNSSNTDKYPVWIISNSIKGRK
ncbi:MAG: hypothetical protein LBU37_07720 [Tannerellaceae bacterium]|nr:hypothetical protein [Tannerellaceae bacterium]